MDDDSLAGRIRVRIARGTTPNAMTIVRAIVCNEPGAVQFAQRSTRDEPAGSIREALEQLVGRENPTEDDLMAKEPDDLQSHSSHS